MATIDPMVQQYWNPSERLIFGSQAPGWEGEFDSLPVDAAGGFTLPSQLPYSELTGLVPPLNRIGTFEGDPGGLYRAIQQSQLSDARSLNPYFQQQIGAGLTPTLGRYMLADPVGTGTFADYLRQGTAPDQAEMSRNWADAVRASRGLISGDPSISGQVSDYRGLLVGDYARANAIAMARAKMGGYRGWRGEAQERALKNLYDIYAARARANVQAPGGYLSYLSDLMGNEVPASAPSTTDDRWGEGASQRLRTQATIPMNGGGAVGSTQAVPTYYPSSTNRVPVPVPVLPPVLGGTNDFEFSDPFDYL